MPFPAGSTITVHDHADRAVTITIVIGIDNKEYHYNNFPATSRQRHQQTAAR